MPEPQSAALPDNMDLGNQFSISWDAVDVTTGNTVPNVTVSNGTLLAADLVTALLSGGGPEVPLGPWFLVPGPEG